MPIESKMTGGVKPLEVRSKDLGADDPTFGLYCYGSDPESLKSDKESFDYLIAAILNILQGNPSILSISTLQSGDQDISAEGSSLSEATGQQAAGNGKDAGSHTAEIGIKPWNIFPNFDNAANSNNVKFAQPIKESPEVIQIPGNTVVITKKDDASIDILYTTSASSNSSEGKLLQKPVTMLSEIRATEPQSPLGNASTKSSISEVLSELNKFTALEQPAAGKGKDAGSHTAEIAIKPGSIFPNFDNAANSNNVKFAQPIKESPESTYIPGNAFIVTRKDDASIDVFLGTKSLGKLHIELTLDKGMINAHINVSDTIGKELIVNNLHNILNTLNNEGLNVGSFSVSLKDKRNEAEDNVGEEDTEAPQSRKEMQLPISYWDMRGVSIFI
ncbi:MAG: flagellar hook-length control protein FliK [Desulfobacterales bacterium]|nr:flagellar hook-length control protein FliK [Desulfobacterales bacterium]